MYQKLKYAMCLMNAFYSSFSIRRLIYLRLLPDFPIRTELGLAWARGGAGTPADFARADWLHAFCTLPRKFLLASIATEYSLLEEILDFSRLTRVRKIEMSPGERRPPPRNRPVSCYFCRSRKLRCSRQAPCSNCLSRGVSCTLQPLPAPRSSEPHNTSSIQATQANPDSASNSELLARIQRLEQVVLSQQSEDARRDRSRKRSPPAQPVLRRTSVSPSYGAASSEIEATAIRNLSAHEGMLVSFSVPIFIRALFGKKDHALKLYSFK